MALFSINTLQDGTAHYTQSVDLDGRIYVMDLDFNGRDGFWRMSLADSDSIPIQGCVGRKLVANWAPLRSVDPRRPPGEIVITGGFDRAPGLDDLGQGQGLYYLDAAELGRPLDLFEG